MCELVGGVKWVCIEPVQKKTAIKKEIIKRSIATI